ncbi:hypothetical protein D3C86_1216090 [compost metagenome]
MIAEGVQTARAELRAAGGAVKQARNGGAAYPARLIVLKLSLGNTDIGFPGPVLVTHIARQSADELIDVIGVGLQTRTRKIQVLPEHKVRRRIGTRGQDLGEVGADIGIGDGNIQGIGQARQRRVEDTFGLIAGQRALDEEVDIRRDLIVHAREQRIALIVVLNAVPGPAPQHIGAGRVQEGVVGLGVTQVHHLRRAAEVE